MEAFNAKPTRALFPALLGILLLMFVASLIPAAVSAHAALERSEPPAGTVLPESPAELKLWFTEPLESAFTGADLLDASGAPVAGVSSAIADQDAHLLVVTPPALTDGAYTVAWRTLSSADGHTLEGYFGFSVGEGGSAPTIAPPFTADQRARELSRASPWSGSLPCWR